MMKSEKIIFENNMNITITEKINLQKVLYLYSLNQEELFKFCKKDKDTKYYNSTINTLADYIINGNDTNDKIYVKNNCNRYYCNNSLQLLQTDIRNFIYPDNTYDYDIKNCSASIMLYLSKINNLDHKHIEYYINNRDNIIEKYKTTKEELKEMVNKLSNIDNPYKTNKVEIDDFINEFNFNKKILINIYKNILPNKNYNEKTNPISSKYCEIFYYFESQIVQKVMNKYKDNVICYMFDGFNTNKKLDLHEINEITKDYGVEWINKPIETKFNYDKVITYDDIKNKLEKHIYKNFTLYDVSDTYGLCEKYYKYISRTIKYCKDLWYILDSKTNLWKCVKEVQPYFLEILRIGLKNGKDIIKNELNCATQEENTDKIKELTEKLEKQNKNFCNMDKSSFCNQFKKNITQFISDNEFDNLLDKESYIFAFKNGIYNIKDKTFRSGIYPSDYLTQTLDFDYDENINDKNIKYIHDEITKICNMNEICKDYYLSILAYALCGDPSRYEDMYCLIGQSASNGKSKLIEALIDIFPIYVAKSNVKVLESNFEKKHKFILDFAKYRLLYLNEFDEKKTIDSQMFKDLGDGESISNEVMFGTTNNIKLKAKPFITSNYTPKFDQQDKGVERRYKHLQFNSVFGDIEDIENLKFKKNRNFKEDIINCKNELVHILLSYAHNVYINGLPEYPKEYLEEKKSVLGMNNEFGDWFEYAKTEEKIIIDKQSFCSSHILRKEYNKYAYENNLEKLDKNKHLIDKMKQLGYKYDRQKMIDKKKGVFIGLSIVENDSD
jgi:phage/plasmid-associated DNA primase